jgi:hypothetical protein
VDYVLADINDGMKRSAASFLKVRRRRDFVTSGSADKRKDDRAANPIRRSRFIQAKAEKGYFGDASRLLSREMNPGDEYLALSS